jgi:hypothetical protein
MKEWIRAMAGMAAMAASASAIANVSDGRVDTCNQCTLQQVEAKAIQRYVPSMVEVHVLDYAHELVWTCEVVREREFNANVASCGLAPPAAQQVFKEVAGLVRQLNSEVSIPYPGGNIYDIAGCPACARGWLLDNRYRLANQLSVVDLLAARGLALAASLNVWRGAVSASYEGQIRVKVILENDASGGREKAYCIGTLTNTELVVDTNRCVDSDGNPIPTLANPLPQDSYVFLSTVNQQNMINRLRSTGRVVRSGGTVTVGQPGRIDCNSNDCESKEKEPSSGGK